MELHVSYLDAREAQVVAEDGGAAERARGVEVRREGDVEVVERRVGVHRAVEGHVLRVRLRVDERLGTRDFRWV